jgi:SAM-dependent methyltransferase
MLPAKTEQPILDAIFDTGLVIAHKRRALRHRLDGATFLLDHVLSDLGERLSTVDRRFERAAVLFGVVPDTAEILRACGQVEQVIRIEADTAFRGDVLVPPETVELEPGSIDLAVSMLALHETNDVPGVLAQIRRALRPDGLFLAALPGAGTLVELRESLLAAELELTGGAAARVSPFVDVRDAGALLQRAGFALPVADIEPLTVRCARWARPALLPGGAAGRRRGSSLRARPRSTPSGSPTRMAGSGQASPSCGCPAGLRTPRSRSPPDAAAPMRDLQTS